MLVGQLWPKTGNPLSFFTIFFCQYHVFLMFQKNYHGTVENKIFAEHILVLVSIKFCQLVDQLRTKMENPLAIFSLCLLILCLPNVSNKLYRVIGEDRLSIKYKVRLVSVAWENIVSDHGAATA